MIKTGYDIFNKEALSVSLINIIYILSDFLPLSLIERQKEVASIDTDLLVVRERGRDRERGN